MVARERYTPKWPKKWVPETHLSPIRRRKNSLNSTVKLFWNVTKRRMYRHKTRCSGGSCQKKSTEMHHIFSYIQRSRWQTYRMFELRGKGAYTWYTLKFKHAIVTPLETKGTRDTSQLKNYRPASNLPFLSKLLEKVVHNQLQHHITSNDAMPKFQSAYRQFRSTETALVKIFNDLLLPADQEQVSALFLLDLTSAFDTVDHALLLTRLQRSFGV